MKTSTLSGNIGKLLCLSIILLTFALQLSAQTTNGRAYNLVYSAGIKGGHTAFGNTNMAIYKADNTTIDVAKMNDFSVLANGQTSPNTNNSTNMRFVDVDGEATTTNSSTADLVLPAGTNTIKFARIYWGAKITAGMGKNANIDLRKVKIRKGTSGTYDSLLAPVTQIDKLLAEGTDSAYSCYTDITSYIQTKGAGTYSVANIVGRTGSTTQGCFAGWSIVVVYENATQPYSSVRVYDGYQDVGGNNGNSFTTTLTGFNAPATPLAASDAYMTAMAWEGDAVPISSSVSDYLQINGNTVSNALNPGNNFWNSTISNNGAFVTTKNPDYKTQMGIDLDRVDVGVGYGIAANATSVAIKFGTTGDHYFPTVFAFTMVTKNPTITITKTASDSLAPFNNLQSSEAVTYTLTGKNTGVGAANGVIVVDTLPSNIIYVPGSMVVVSSPGTTAGSKTDANDADVAVMGTSGGKTYVKFFIGTGATSSAGGTLQPNETYTVTFKARAFADPNLLSAVSNTARITGQALSGDLFVDESTAIINPVAQGGSIGHFVWNDYNGNGIQDPGEPGIPGVTVTLTYPNSFTGSTTTDINGNYSFTGLQPGNYSIAFTTPAGYAVSPSNQGGDDAKDSDPVGGSVALTIVANENNSTTDAGFICSGTHNVTTQTSCEAFTWNGTEYKVTGKYTFSYFNANGCPSVDTLKLTINNGSHIVTTQTSCEAFTWNGTEYKVSGTYTFAYNNATNGCPSVDTLKLTINNGTHNVTTQTACEAFTWNGTEYKSSGTYTFAYNNETNGCPSVDTLKLTINNGSHIVTTQTSCEAFTWNGTEYKASGIYTFAYNNEANGCPSVDTLKLTINNGSHIVTTQTSCEAFTWNGTEYKASGIYTFAYNNEANGCPSVDTLKLTINNGSHNVFTETSCEAYTWNGTEYKASGTYTFAYNNATNGCPSVDTLKLTINNGSHNVFTETACEAYTWNGTEYKASGTYTFAYNNATNGCPSVDTLKLTINNGSHNVFTETACEAYTWHGTEYTTGGTYTFAYNNATNGCPSVDTLKLTINNGSHNVFTETSCESYTWHGVEYKTGGTYTFAYNNEANGCPSVDTLKLTINNGSHNVFTETSCESYTWNGVEYTESGSYTFAYENETGCPSVDTLKLTINNGSHNVFTEKACGSFIWNGVEYTESGTYEFAYQNQNGCSSVDTLKLTINQGSHNSFTETANDFYTWHEQLYTESGTYTFAYENETGCPSVDTLHLTIKTNGPLPVTTINFTATPENSNVKLNWLIGTEINVKAYEVEFSKDGSSFVKVGNVDATNKTGYNFIHASPVQGVNYYRIKIINNDGSVQYTIIRSVKFTKTVDVNVYPNPVVSELTISIPQAFLNKSVKIQLYNNVGQLLITNTYRNAQQVERLGVMFMPSGVYDLRIILPDNTQQTKRIQIVRK